MRSGFAFVVHPTVLPRIMFRGTTQLLISSFEVRGELPEAAVTKKFHATKAIEIQFSLLGQHDAVHIAGVLSCRVVSFNTEFRSRMPILL